jgi:hypothetical protein
MKTLERTPPLSLRAALPFVLLYLTFLPWWWLVTYGLGADLVIEALVLSYVLPVAVSLAAFGGASWRGKAGKGALLPFITFGILAVVFWALLLPVADQPLRWMTATPQADAGPVITTITASPLDDPPLFLGIAFISAVVTLMTYPVAGRQTYFLYRSPVCIAGFVFMPLFIPLSSVLRAPLDLTTKAYAILAIMVGFWASGAWMASRRAEGTYVRGCEIRPMVPFRPDLIFPGGVLLVKGVILTGVGLMIMIHDHLSLPRWNWWGFTFAFIGIVSLIPVRGMLKMFFGRRARMTGEQGLGLGKEILLFVGLLILLYGFVSAFKGFTPFTAISVLPRYSSLPNPPGWLGLGLIVLSFIALVPLRGWVKRRLPEGAESYGQLLGKQALLYAGILLLILGYIQVFNLPKDATMTGDSYLGLHPDKNPIGFAVGAILFSFGAVLILPLRPLALMNEFEATVRNMVGIIADAPDEVRRQFMAKRIAVLAAMPERQRDVHVRLMVEGLQGLPGDVANRLRETMLGLLVKLTPEGRVAIMRSMDKAMLGGSPQAR